MHIFARRNFQRLQDIFFVLPALEKEPVPVAAREVRMANFEKNGLPHNLSGGSMQSEFDREDLLDFLQERPAVKK